MRITNGFGSYKTRHDRARAARKPKIRWEVLGLTRPLRSGATTSIEDIRRKVSHMANNGLGPSPDTIEERAKPATTVPVSSGRRRG
jgi:hypothetical protein